MTGFQLQISMQNAKFHTEIVVLQNGTQYQPYVLIFSSSSDPVQVNLINIALKGFNFSSINNELNHIWTCHFHYNFNVRLCVTTSHFCQQILSMKHRTFQISALKRSNSNDMFVTRIADLTAIAVSVGTIIVAFLYIPLIIMKITEMNERVNSLLCHKVFTVFCTHSTENLLQLQKSSNSKITLSVSI
ncbi:hypothetical protein WUBG_06223 [Wuchereria bancrofti]|uniref:Uncharacterized protein n=1 Tax=Wuchereria bancrofti TaxID=6293 RepID=J9F088_WUCBA|nr:hypothetical protein WUBG_06223 [Wuchereria bancrofti]